MSENVLAILIVAIVAVSGLAALLDHGTGFAIARQSAVEARHLSRGLAKAPMVRVNTDDRTFFVDESGVIHFSNSSLEGPTESPITG